MTSGMAVVIYVDGNSAMVELGSGERKTANIPHNIEISDNDRVLVMRVSGKYLIINVY